MATRREPNRTDRANLWFAGALASALLVAGVDVAASGEGAALIGLLALPPLVAAIGSGIARTAAVGAGCALAGLVLGLADHVFGTREHVIEVAAIAAVGGAAFWIARLRERREAQGRRSKLIADAGAALQSSFDPGAALSELARLAVPAVADWCVVYVKQGDGSLAQVAAAHRDPERVQLVRELARRYPPLPDRPSGIPAVVRSGRPEVHESVPDAVLEQTAQSPEHLEALRSLGLRASLLLPLTARGRTLGGIAFMLAESDRAFGGEERRLAETLAERAAVALDNMQLYGRAAEAERELRESRDQLMAILDGVADGVTAQDATGRMVYANEAALALLGFPSLEAIQAVPIRYVLSQFEVFAEDGRPFPLERLPGRLALRGETPADELIKLRSRDSGATRWSIVKATPIRGARGDVVLAINIYEDVTEHMERERSQRVLGRVGEALARSLSHERTLVDVADLCVPEVADLVTVDVAEAGQIRRVAAAARDDDVAREVIQQRRRYPFDPNAPTGVPAVIRSGAAELHPDLDPETFAREAASPNQRDLIARLGLRSAMFVPMSVRGRTVGALTFGRAHRAFGEAELNLAEQIAARCAMAVDNARLFRERTRIARTLQESLLPPLLPDLPGADVGARFHAAGEAYEVGGDFYDVFEIGGGSFGVAIGDVCGKGPDAAAVTALARYTLRATAMREPSPAEVLRTLNDEMIRQIGERRFCTVAYVRFDPTTFGLRATVASGGHPLPLVLRADGTPREAGTPGTLLGVISDPEIEDAATDLGTGDSLVLFTDGVTEARAPARVWESDDLARFVGVHEPLSAAAIAERIERGALSAPDEQPRDDVAIVVLKVTGAVGAAPVVARGEGVTA